MARPIRVLLTNWSIPTIRIREVARIMMWIDETRIGPIWNWATSVVWGYREGSEPQIWVATFCNRMPKAMVLSRGVRKWAFLRGRKQKRSTRMEMMPAPTMARIRAK